MTMFHEIYRLTILQWPIVGLDKSFHQEFTTLSWMIIQIKC